MKYVMIDHSFPIVFPDNIDHCSFQNVGKITSAGFLHIKNKKVEVFGNSVSLKNLGPETGDDLFLTAFLKGYSDLDLTNMQMLMLFSMKEERKNHESKK